MKLRLTYTIIFFVGLCFQKAFPQAFRITELALKPAGNSGKFWVEVKNVSADVATLNGYTLRLTHNLTFELNPDTLGIHAYSLYEGFLPLDPDSIEEITLADSSGIIVDQVALPSIMLSGESFGRFPEQSDSFIYFPQSKISPGTKNLYVGPWTKLTNHTAFSPRDSAPNAIITHDGKFWLFEGWEHLGSDIFEAVSKVWVSSDMVNWEVVNENPPYNPYSAFVSYKGKMWAFDHASWSSVDGISWTKEADEFPGALATRATVLRDTLWFAKGSSIWYTVDGKDWEFTCANSTPWLGRDWPMFVTFNDKLWFFGGGNGYGTPYELTYTDVWSSSDGRNWEYLTEAPWPSRLWATAAVFDDKIWMLGGYNVAEFDTVKYGNLNDVWTTVDGFHWEVFSSHEIWSTRHAALTVATDTALYVSSGFGGGGTAEGLRNDVWRLSAKKPFYFEKDPIVVTYGDQLIPEPLEITSLDETILAASQLGVLVVGVGTSSALLRKPGNQEYFENDTILSVVSTKRSLILKPQPAEKFYGDDNPHFEFEIIGLVDGETKVELNQLPQFSTPAGKLSTVGTYPVNVTGGEDDHYSYILQNGTLEIRKRPLYASPDPVSRIFGEVNPPPVINYSGFVGDDTENDLEQLPSVVTDAEQLSDVGSYRLSVIGGFDDQYDVLTRETNLVISKRILHVAPTPTSKRFAEENPRIELTFSGLAEGDDLGRIDQLPEITTTATQYSPVGNYPIVLLGGSDDNYELIAGDALLTIEPGDGVQVFPNPAADDVNIFMQTCDSGHNNVQVQITDRTGRELLRKTMDCLDPEPISLLQLEAGVYILVVQSASEKFISRIIKL